MTICYQILPLPDPTAPKVESRRKAGAATPSAEAIEQNREDAEYILALIALNHRLSSENRINSKDKYLIETALNQPPAASRKKETRGKKKSRKPHYAHLLQIDNRLLFQVACCQPLTVIAASLDGNTTSGRILYKDHTEDNGGKLVIEFADVGHEIIIDMQRGESSKVQRYLFAISMI